MRQAIEQGFILDLLENYTLHKLALRLARNGKDYDETEVERGAAMKGIMQWVSPHPYNIAAKIQIVVEHYRENVQPLLAGKGKAMVVLGRRKDAVRWQKAIRDVKVGLGRSPGRPTKAVCLNVPDWENEGGSSLDTSSPPDGKK